MIRYLNGPITQLLDQSIIIEANGIGYEVLIPERIKAQLPELGTPFKIHTHHHIREDSHLLFGFSTPEDRDFFVLLTSVSGIGPKVGLKILSTLSKEDLIPAILSGNLATITQLPGVGKKMAERMIIELKDKLGTFSLSSSPNITSKESMPAQTHEDLITAMKTLGYQLHEIKAAIAKSQHELKAETSLEQGLKLLLKYL